MSKKKVERRDANWRRVAIMPGTLAQADKVTRLLNEAHPRPSGRQAFSRPEVLAEAIVLGLQALASDPDRMRSAPSPEAAPASP